MNVVVQRRLRCGSSSSDTQDHLKLVLRDNSGIAISVSSSTYDAGTRIRLTMAWPPLPSSLLVFSLEKASYQDAQEQVVQGTINLHKKLRPRIRSIGTIDMINPAYLGRALSEILG
jgi:hypothetical protein